MGTGSAGHSACNEPVRTHGCSCSESAQAHEVHAFGCCRDVRQHVLGVHRPFDVTFFSDAIGASRTSGDYEPSIHLNYPLIGNAVVTVNEYLAAIGVSPAGCAGAQSAEAVRGFRSRGRLSRLKDR